MMRYMVNNQNRNAVLSRANTDIRIDGADPRNIHFDQIKKNIERVAGRYYFFLVLGCVVPLV
jgi:hypothetical protein